MSRSLDAYRADIKATLAYVERGLTYRPLADAIDRIDEWREWIEAEASDDLRPLAETLTTLRDHLSGTPRNGDAIGAAMQRLGRQTRTVAETAAPTLEPSLRRLASILLRAGNAIAGNAIAGNAIAGNAIAGNAIAGNAIAGNAIAGNAIAGNAIAGNAIAGNAIAGNDALSPQRG